MNVNTLYMFVCCMYVGRCPKHTINIETEKPRHTTLGSLHLSLLEFRSFGLT